MCSECRQIRVMRRYTEAKTNEGEWATQVLRLTHVVVVRSLTSSDVH